MKLNKKFHIIMFLYTLGAIIFVSVLVNSVNQKNYIEVEEVIFDGMRETFKNTIVNEIDTMEYILNDWSVWNATYEYISGERSNYIEDNITSEAYRDLNINYIAIFNEDMELLYGEKFNEDNGKLEEIEKDTINIFKKHINEEGIIMVDESLILYSSMKITDNYGLSPAKGLMVFARNVDEGYKKEIEKKTNYNIELSIADREEKYEHNFSLHDYGIKSDLQHIEDNNDKIITGSSAEP